MYLTNLIIAITVFVPAEKFLEGVEVNQNYPILLLHLIDKDGIDMTIRVAAAIAFKNYIKRNWPVVCQYFVHYNANANIHVPESQGAKKICGNVSVIFQNTVRVIFKNLY